MPYLYYTHAESGCVLGKPFTHRVLSVTDDEANHILGTFWRLATAAEIEAATPRAAEADPVKKTARKAKPA